MGAVVRAFVWIAAGTLCAGLVAGCGSDDGGGADLASDSGSPTVSPEPSEEPTEPAEEPSEEPSETPAPASWPACSDVWVAGADLPQPYDGCADAAGLAVPAQAIRCSMGAVLITYDDRFWGVPGHKISQAEGRLAKEPAFEQARATCTA